MEVVRINGADKSNGLAISAHPQESRPLQREIDTALANEARCSRAHVKLARRLIRNGNENLATAAMLGVLPLTTAARAGTPRRRNATYQARDRLIATLVGGAQ
jgi:hypothetical protein